VTIIWTKIGGRPTCKLFLEEEMVFPRKNSQRKKIIKVTGKNLTKIMLFLFFGENSPSENSSKGFKETLETFGFLFQKSKQEKKFFFFGGN